MKNNMLTPVPTLISYMWNMGSMMMMLLLIQLVSGLLLSMHYNSSTEMAFESVTRLMNYINNGWIIRLIHVNGASLYFMIIYMHMFKGMMFKSWKLKKVWMSGLIIYILSMITAFLGYILPWGQMSFWAATVITNLLTAIPTVGDKMVTLIWGGFAVSSPTLNRFFTLHFIIPFVILFMMMIHLMVLHEKGSTNPLGISMSKDKIPFHPMFTNKDLTTLIMVLMTLITLSTTKPFIFIDPDNFIPSNPMSTPEHIQPEWYFLFAYSILRAVPNKIGGVTLMAMSIMTLFTKSLTKPNQTFKYSNKNLMAMSLFSTSFIMLSILGANPAEPPFTMMMQLFSISYFISLILI